MIYVKGLQLKMKKEGAHDRLKNTIQITGHHMTDAISQTV